MNRLLCVVLVAPLFFASRCEAGDLLARMTDLSEHVLVVECVAAPRHGQITLSEGFFGNYSCKFKVIETLKGRMQPETLFNHNVKIPIEDGERAVPLEHGKKYILFLQGDQATDLWFGVQCYSAAIAKSITRRIQEH